MSQPPATQWQSVTTADLNATIVAGQTVSNAIDLEGTFLTGLIIPSNFDGSQLQFQTSRDGISFGNYRNTSNDIVTITVTAGDNFGIVPSDFASWRYLKLVCVTTQTTTNTIIGLVTRPLS